MNGQSGCHTLKKEGSVLNRPNRQSQPCLGSFRFSLGVSQTTHTMTPLPRKDIHGILGWDSTLPSVAIRYGESMTITAFYYLQYPDCLPADPLLGVSEVYVEVAENGDIHNFDSTYALTICTIGFLKQHLETHRYYSSRSLIIVDRFEDQVIRAALEAILPRIDELATKK